MSLQPQLMLTYSLIGAGANSLKINNQNVPLLGQFPVLPNQKWTVGFKGTPRTTYNFRYGSSVIAVRTDELGSATIEISVASLSYRTGNYQARLDLTPLQAPSGRYKVISPVLNGTYYESVSNLSPEDVANFRARGFKVEATNLGLSPAVQIRGNPAHTTNYVPRNARRGFTGSYVAPSTRRYVLQNVIRKSTIAKPRRLFAEPKKNNLFAEATHKICKGGSCFQASPSPNDIEIYKRNGYTITPLTTTAPPVTTPTMLTPQPISVDQNVNWAWYWIRKAGYVTRYAEMTDAVANQYRQNGYTLQKASKAPSAYIPIHRFSHLPKIQTTTPTTPTVPTDRDQTGEVARLQNELQTLRLWLEETNNRLSQQVVDLGGSTTDRSEEIKDLQRTVLQLNQRVSYQLEQLGNAVQTNSNLALELQKAQALINEINQTKGSGGSVWDSLSGIFGGQYGNYALIGVGLLVLLLVIRR